MVHTRRARGVRRARRSRARQTRYARRRVRGGMENLLDHLREVFPEFDASRFKITEEDGYNQVKIEGCEEEKRHPKQFSPRISIFEDGHMSIGRLTSCSPLGGAEMIQRYILLARRLGLQSIHLDDNSEVYFPRSRYGDNRCKIDLPTLRILLKGKSWYESLGFVSTTTDAERAQNEEVRQMPFEAFVQRLIEKERQAAREYVLRRYAYHKNPAKRNADLAEIEEKKSELGGIFDVFPEIYKATPVYQAIKIMVDRVNATEDACESEPFRMLQTIIDRCTATDDPVIHYRMDDLTMTL
jgi:hypothetical protein